MTRNQVNRTISLIVPPNNSAFMQDLRNSIMMGGYRSTINLDTVADNNCRVEVGIGTSRTATWWAVKKIVSQVEDRQKTGRVVEFIG